MARTPRHPRRGHPGELGVELVVRAVLPREEVEEARAYVSALGHYVRLPSMDARLALDAITGLGFRYQYVAHAQLIVRGRTLAARALGPSAGKAAEDAAERLRRQLARLTEADVAMRNEPRVIERAMRDLVGDHRPPPPIRVKPPEERQVVPRCTYARGQESTLSAVADLLDLDEQFHLFSHVGTKEDVVVHWRSDGRLGLLFPPGSPLADENDVVVPKPSRYSAPLTLVAARAEMDMLGHRFLYFLHADDERGRVLYLRFDGDYGMVHP